MKPKFKYAKVSHTDLEELLTAFMVSDFLSDKYFRIRLVASKVFLTEMQILGEFLPIVLNVS